MWVRQADYDWLKERIETLETLLANERAENRRVERHWGDMILRRGGSLPVPPLPVEKPPTDEKPALSESDRVKVQAVVQHGRSMNLPQTEITEAVQGLHLGLTEAEITAAINASRNGQSLST